MLRPLSAIILMSGFQLASAQASPNIDYKNIFSGEENWSAKKEFLAWATPMEKKDEKKPCRPEIKKRIAEVDNGVLFCEQVATLNTVPAIIVWANFKTAKPSQYGHDCNAGLIYLDQKQKIVENSPADCDYVKNIEDPASTPILVFKVNRSGAVGMVFDGHGEECWGRAVLEQKGRLFEHVHELYWNCLQ